jgi:cytosine/adenosine deaminase-related metal-dependent hydrolase
MKLTSLFNKVKNRDPTAMPCWKSLRMATVEGAEAIGIPLLMMFSFGAPLLMMMRC